MIDTTTNKVLMLSSRKSEGSYRLPRGNCDENETPEEAVARVLHDEAGIQVDKVTLRVGTYTEANKKGKIVGHHWIFEVKDPKILDSWPALDRKRVWVSFLLRGVEYRLTFFLLNQFTHEEAVAASADRHISRLALNSCSLSH